MSNKDSEIKLQITRQKYARPSPRKHGPDGLAAFTPLLSIGCGFCILKIKLRE